MFGFRKSPKPSSSDTNASKPARRAASEPELKVPDMDDYKDDFRDSGGLENQSVQDLEKYAVYKAEETTSTVNNCLKIAEDIKDDATRTLDMLHQQGEQINRTHQIVADTDKDLSKGEKLLNNLGGMFSKPWKPKKTREIKGPMITPDKPPTKNDKQAKEREKLGVGANAKGSRTPPPEPTNAMQKVELEKARQDDALSDLSDVLGQLKGMAVDMGSEIERQNKALDHLSDDVDEINSRVKGANQRTRRLIGK